MGAAAGVRVKGVGLLFALTLLALAGCSSGSSPSSGPSPTGTWKMVWSDDFDGSSLDPAKWAALNQSTYGDGNKEVACLMSRPENVQVAGGQLQISARHETPPLQCGGQDTRFPQGRDYSSGMILTRDLASWTYGRFEIRAKLPTTPGHSQGMWPALWLRPVDGGDGEIDIMEAVGGPASQPANHVEQTVWYDYSGSHPKISKSAGLPSGATDTGFHVDALEWEPGSLTFSVDGHQTMRADASWVKQAFARPFFLRINLAVGGSWPGEPDAETTLPSSLDVDYVHVYQRQ
jgi:beta-glucanase (GH16 family)